MHHPGYLPTMITARGSYYNQCVPFTVCHQSMDAMVVWVGSFKWWTKLSPQQKHFFLHSFFFALCNLKTSIFIDILALWNYLLFYIFGIYTYNLAMFELKLVTLIAYVLNFEIKWVKFYCVTLSINSFNNMLHTCWNTNYE